MKAHAPVGVPMHPSSSAPWPRMRWLLPLTLALATLCLATACRSLTPDSAPVQAAPPDTAATGPNGVSANNSADADALDDITADTAPAAEPPCTCDGTAPPPSKKEAEETLREALELCQSAGELLGQGEISDAIAAVDRAYTLMLQVPPNGDAALARTHEEIRLLIANLITKIYRSGESVANATSAGGASWDAALPSIDNEHVQREIKSLTTVEREEFLQGYRRSGRYRPMIVEKLQKAGLPSQLSWLPLVESWFKVRALSRASALGLWQFITSTGLRYGLNRDDWSDERLMPDKATDAAVVYLIDLHRLFGDWLKALAAYNCGEGLVQRLQRRSADEYLDFWDLYLLLPQETRRYVPRLIAVIKIINNPAQYGVTLPTPDKPLPETVTVAVERSVQLSALDAALGLAPGTLAELNPGLRYQATPDKPFHVHVPVALAAQATAAIAKAPVWKRPVPEYVTHRVRSGDTLSTIATRYRTSIAAIMRANRIRSANRIWPGQRLRIPTPQRS